MSTDGNSIPGGNTKESSVKSAKAALSSLLIEHRSAKKPSQEELAHGLKKEIEALRSQGVTFGRMSERLKEAGIVISPLVLGAAIKKKAGRASTSAIPESRQSPSA